jgi:chromosome segregation ATPase
VQSELSYEREFLQTVSNAFKEREQAFRKRMSNLQQYITGDLNAQRERYEARCEAVKKLADLEAALRAEREQRSATEKQVSETETQLRSQIQTIEHANAEFAIKLEAAEKQNREQTELLNELRGSSERSENELSQRLEQLQGEHRQATAALRDAQLRLEELTRQHDNAITDAKQKAEELAIAESQAQESAAREQELTQQNSELQSRLIEMDTRLEQ